MTEYNLENENLYELLGITINSSTGDVSKINFITEYDEFE